MAANSYKPKSVGVAAHSPVSNPIVLQNLTTTLWSHILLKGTAKLSGGAAISDAAVLVWYTAVSAGITFDNVDTATFTDNTGRYAVTVPTARPLIIKVYS